MKKTLLAVSIATLFAAGSASAVEVYNQDGTKVGISGKLDVQFINDMNDAADKTELDNVLKVDDSEFGFAIGHELDNGMTVGGVLKFEANKGSAKATDAYVGVKFAEFGTFSAGYQATIYDDAGIGTDMEFGPGAYYEQTETSGQQVIKYKFDNDVFYTGVAYMLNNTMAESDDVSVVDGNIGVRLGGFDLAIYVGSLQKDFVMKKKIKAKDAVPGKSAAIPGQKAAYSGNMSRAALQGTYTIGDLTVGLSYEISDNEGYKNSGFGGGIVSYDLNKWNFSGGVFAIQKVEVEDATYSKFNKDAATAGYLNTTYHFSKYVSTYAEVGLSDADGSEVGYVAGMIAKF